MEKISAACAMEWSMELEKALRSKKPGQAVKAIQQIGERLELLSREPKPTMAVYNMFGLVPGEDRLFANTILLRLADAFRFGDKGTRYAIVRVFFSEFKNRCKQQKSKKYDGILSKDRVQNPMELLKRVKIVFDTGDVESRALALILFGCWADFAKDSIHVRYLILSHLVSSQTLEVKASLFSAGCFSELAVDFASVALEMLLNIVISHESSLAIRLAGARVFAKMGCSYSIANRALQIGAKLLLDFSDEDFSVAMLVSLSKLAARSILLLSEQVSLLLVYINQEKSLRLRATTLRCLHFMLTKGVCHAPLRIHLINLLLKIVDETELPSAMQCEALQILQRMLVHQLSDLDCDEILEVTHMLTIVQKAAQSPVPSKSLLAIRILIDVSVKLRGRSRIKPDGYCFSSLPTIFSILVDQIISLVKPGLDVCKNDSEILQELQSLLNHLYFLVGECPDLGVLVLDKTRFIIEYVVDMHDRNLATMEADASVDDFVEFRGPKGMNISLNLVNNVQKFSLSFIENLNEVGSISSEILNKVKLLVESVLRCRLFKSYIHLKYSILLHSQIILGFILNMNEESSRVCEHSSTSLIQQLVESEILSLGLADKMLRKRDYWHTYKAGMFATYQGALVTASYIFAQLVGKVQSDSFSCWLKGLAKFAESEMKIQLFLIPNLGSSLLTLLQLRKFCIKPVEDYLNEIGRGASGNINEPNHSEVLIGAYYGLRSSEKTLKSIPMLGNSCCFQRWFLALRAKLLRTVTDALKVLGSVPDGDGNNRAEQAEKSITAESLYSLRQISEMSSQFKGVADEFDLIVMSFIGMDIRSSKIISALALSCSLLAFTTAFATFVSNLSDHETFINTLESSRNSMGAIFIENLVERLWCIDQETCSNLCLLLEAGRQNKYCFHSQSRNQMLNSGGKMRDILDICRHAVSTIVALKNEAKGVQDGEILSRIATNGFQVVSGTISKCMRIPFRIPKYFFRMRPCILSELFACSANVRNPDKLTVLPGFHLSINLGLQLHNLLPDVAVRIKKLYCIVCSSTSFWEPGSGGNNRDGVPFDFNAPDISMIGMNKKLLQYVTDQASEPGTFTRANHPCNDSNEEIVYSFARFELNDRGQGFSNCLLNVSNFPVGCYRINWHSCCIDKEGCYWSLIPQNSGPIFTVQDSPVNMHIL